MRARALHPRHWISASPAYLVMARSSVTIPPAAIRHDMSSSPAAAAYGAARDVGGGAVFGSPDNEAVVLSASGEAVSVPRGSKESLAHVVWDQVAALLDVPLEQGVS